MTALGLLTQTSPVLSLSGGAADLTSTAKAIIQRKDGKIIDGICGFVFDIPQSDSLTLSAEITDHWTESNTSIQDHVAIAPLKLNLTGIIAELVWEKSKGAAAAEQAIQRFMEVPGMKPKQAQDALLWLAGYDEIQRQYEQAKKVYNDLATFFDKNLIANTKQGKAYEKLQSLFVSRTLCTVNTPWIYLTNMVIENMTITQDETTKDMSTISVTLKQINSVEITATKVALQPVPQSQRADVKEQGTVNKSILATGLDAVTTGTAAFGAK
jgi:hypothetical protein